MYSCRLYPSPWLPCTGDVVLNPFLGPRYKADVVTTDMPLEIDRPIDFGLQDFCRKCGRCDEKMGYHKPNYENKWWLDLDHGDDGRFFKPEKLGFNRKR